MTIAFTTLSSSRFWSRHVLLSGPKLQNTNCTDMFSTAVTRHKQQTSGRLRTANNTIVKCFFQIHAPGKCFISSIMSKFWWYTFHRQHKPPSSPEQRIFPLIFIATIRQIFCLSPLMLMRIWCQFFCNLEYRLNTPPFLWDYSHIVPLNQIEVTSETWTSIVYNLMISGASGVMYDLHYVVHVLLIDSFLAPHG